MSDMIIGGKHFTLNKTEGHEEHGGRVLDHHYASADGETKIVTERGPTPADEPDGYRELRRKAYEREMPIGEQLDAILKTLNYLQMRKKINATRGLDAIITKWLAIKKRYPKPEVPLVSVG